MQRNIVALRKGHGVGAGVPRIEVLPADELPRPVPAEEAPPAPPLSFGPDGKIADSDTAKYLGSLGGKAKARRRFFVDSLGLKSFAEDTEFSKYLPEAEAYAERHLSELAKLSGGEVGAAAAALVASAGIQLAASRYATDKAARANDMTLFKMASTLMSDCKQSVLAAYELAVRAAQGKPTSEADPLASFRTKQ